MGLNTGFGRNIPSTHNDGNGVSAQQLLLGHPILLILPVVELLNKMRSNIWLCSLSLKPSLHTLITERDHAHPVLHTPEAGQKGKCQSNCPDGMIERAENSECRALLHNSAVPRLRPHHAKVLIECEFTHGVKSKPLHDVVGYYWLAVCACNDRL